MVNMTSTLLARADYQKHKKVIREPRGRGPSTSHAPVSKKFTIKKPKTELQIARMKLDSELSSYNISKDQRFSFRREMTQLKSFSKMNMKYLAAALYILSLSKSQSAPDPEFFQQFDLDAPISHYGSAINTIKERLSGLDPRGTPPEDLMVKRKEVLLTYVFSISHLRTSAIPPPTEQEDYEDEEDDEDEEDRDETSSSDEFSPEELYCGRFFD